MGTLVECATHLLLLARMPGPDSDSVCRGFASKLRSVPQRLRKSLTLDQGRNMARHELLTQKFSLQTCFADPHSLWQRRSNP
jgi:transposase, IS30 family